MDILSWLDGTQFWHWWILALIFAGIEILAPGVFFIWLGAAAALTGAIALVIPGMGWEIEALIFALLAVLSILGWRSYQKKSARDEVPSTLNRRGDQMRSEERRVGKECRPRRRGERGGKTQRTAEADDEGREA